MTLPISPRRVEQLHARVTAIATALPEAAASQPVPAARVRPMTLPISPRRVEQLHARVTAIATALPEARTERVGVAQHHSAFRVRARTFAYFWADHHGDGRVALCAKAPPGAQPDLLENEPERFFVPPYLGPNGWVGLRLEAGEPDWAEIEQVVRVAYRLQAPAKLARLVEGVPG